MLVAFSRSGECCRLARAWPRPVCVAEALFADRTTDVDLVTAGSCPVPSVRRDLAVLGAGTIRKEPCKGLASIHDAQRVLVCGESTPGKISRFNHYILKCPNRSVDPQVFARKLAPYRGEPTVIARLRAIKEDREDGFTLIELLVVMIIIGILAAIAIPVFLSQRQKGYDASVKSDLRTLASETEAYNTDYQSYPGAQAIMTSTATATTGGATSITSTDSVRTSQGNTFSFYLGVSGNDYCIIGVNAKGTRPWEYESSNGGLQPSGTAGSGTTLPTASVTTCTATP
jgi:type IV pilus assembly protein PilA